MTDTFSKNKRSWIMSRVHSENTSPEIIVRSLTHCLGYRYRLHKKELPGKPDLVFPSRKKVIFVHGCFWHGHNCTRGNRRPKTNQVYWQMKIQRNKIRDQKHTQELLLLGWRTLTIWECQLKNPEDLKCILKSFLGSK
ncbi:MAG TPA: very short patch repair endonuclease [Thermodesulfobacteriota bacterium]|nr:very short patch repair endonuclease [Thermodesulfobacteriota bacterium]